MTKEFKQEPRQKRIIGIPAKPVTYHANLSKKESGNIDYADLPIPGLSRWSQIKKFIPVSREKFRQLSIAGKAPQPIRDGIRCTYYRNEEIHEWLNNPLGYTASKEG
jgi:prophage regulatory protein